MNRLYLITLCAAALFIGGACATPPPALSPQDTLRTVRNETPGAAFLPALPAAAEGQPELPPVEPAVISDTLIFSGAALDTGGEGLTLLPEGLGPEADVREGTVTSAVLEAPVTFNAIVPEWVADLPEGTAFELALRTGQEPDALGDWVHIHGNADWMVAGETDTVGDMLVVPAADSRHSFVQYRFTLQRAAETAASPILRELRLVFLDATAGPTIEEMISQQQALDDSVLPDQGLLEGEEAANPKPFVISRAIWCIYPACNYSDGLEYESVTHLILHHTVSGTGAGGNSADTVRAIWSYHTYNRGWGDIGYNFLADTNGVLFEGHLGGDDVIGIHAAGANAGSVGLALIGTYSVSRPPEAMLDAVVDLFSWKAEQRGIDVFDASNTLPNIEWGLPNLMGHRDVYGTTECPGDTAHALLPLVRDRVGARLGLEPPFLVDELSADFSKSANTFGTGPLQCGINAHSWYTGSTTNPGNATHWGEWRPLIPENGRYEIAAYAPYCNTGRPETSGARYAITHLDGTSTVTIDQNEQVGLWSSLGEFNLQAGRGTVIRLTDLTTTDSGVSVWFDALRLRSLEPLPSVQLGKPPDGTLLNGREIMFTWQIENPDKVKATVFQVATDDGFGNRIANEVWASPVEETSLVVDRDYRELFWRVVVTTPANNEIASPTYRFAVDASPPQSAVDRLTWLAFSETYVVGWSGEDEGNAIGGFQIDYRPVAPEEAAWQTWLSGVRRTSALFRPSDPQAAYEFRSQATDAAGNVEAPAETADISTAEARVLDQAAVLPVIITP